jgi:hypothetical protein
MSPLESQSGAPVLDVSVLVDGMYEAMRVSTDPDVSRQLSEFLGFDVVVGKSMTGMYCVQLSEDFSGDIQCALVILHAAVASLSLDASTARQTSDGVAIGGHKNLGLFLDALVAGVEARS